ncbi:hypothetical protein [Pseudomonas paracarnis]|uniref:hypothetical protein n=1 Tax=Pseudomonas paracarnis TaxID=2750625 RepID=UPI001C6FB1A8|nr:hypothetical protein [Pseudomonas paracarnis]MBW9246945.1 hypothetical protein [Pseudomonas paracarnis]
MAFNTGNSVEPNGSTDPRDLDDNSAILDKLVNGSDLTWLGRLGKVLKTWAGIMSDFTAMMASFGYEPNHLVYVDGQPLQVDRTTQLIDYNGGVYRAKMPATFPLALTGSWASDSSKLVDVGDQSLRMQLAGTNGAKNLVGGALFKGEALDPTPVGTSLTRGTAFGYYPQAPLAGAFRVGASDLTSLNDERNYWRGLPSQNAWGDAANIGFASVALNRNGASVAAYTVTTGHDCVAYGTASFVGGAGSATGNPDLFLSSPGNFTGYCSFAYGKNNIAIGEKSACLGEENSMNARSAMGFGYYIVAQPSATEPNPVAPAGIGRSITLFGQAHAFGSYLSASDGVVIGFGANPGTPLHSSAEQEVSIGAGTAQGGLRMAAPLPGQNRSQVAINCQRALDPNVETRIDLGDGKVLGIVTDGNGSSKFSLMGVKNSGLTQPIVDFEWTNPNGGSSAGTFAVKMNGRSTTAFGILENGTPIFQELKDAAGISGAPSGAVYKDGGFLKVVP